MLDRAALERAREKYAREEQMKKLHEWFIYEAPPGVYQKFLEERDALIAEHKERMDTAKYFLRLLIVGALILMGIAFFDM